MSSTQTQAVASAPTLMPLAEFTPSTRTLIGRIERSMDWAVWMNGMTTVQPPFWMRKPYFRPPTSVAVPPVTTRMWSEGQTRIRERNAARKSTKSARARIPPRMPLANESITGDITNSFLKNC